MVGMSKIVFGNKDEMVALAQCLRMDYDHVLSIPLLLNSINRVTVSVSNSESKDWLSNNGIFVMTQGGEGPAIAVWGQGQSAQVIFIIHYTSKAVDFKYLFHLQVQPITPKAPIVDTTGAGDSLAAGFLAGILARKDPKTCLEWGCKMASLIITRLGVTVPNGIQPDFLQ